MTAQTADGTAGLDASGGVLAEIEAQLRAQDTILEPGVLDLLKDYLRAGGRPQSAIEDLSENYAGYAQMCDVMCQWLEIADVRIPTSNSTTRSGPVPAAAATPAEGDVPDEFSLLQELAKECFDPTKFLGAFRRGPPEWLNTLIKDRRGRQLIYDLSATHRNSLLLNYAIQKILKEGHEAEVSMVGGPLASYFEVYHRLLATRLQAATSATTAQELQHISAAIAESCVSSQHTYVHAQQLLTNAAAWVGGAVFKRIAQEVESVAVARHGGAKVYQLQLLFAPAVAGEEELQVIRTVSDILCKSSAGLPGTAAAPHPAAAAQLAAVSDQLQQLQQCYQQQQQLTVKHLRHPKFMELLLAGMFSFSRPLGTPPHSKADLRAICIQLLALAVAGRGPQDQDHQLDPAAANLAAAAGEAFMEELQQTSGSKPDQDQDHDGVDHRSRSDLMDLDQPSAAAAAAARGSSPAAALPPQQQQQQQYSVEQIAQLLQQALELSKKISAPAKLRPPDLEAATQVCKAPVAALGLLQRCQQLLSDEGAYADEKINVVLPNHLSLLHRVACQQQGLIPQVLVVLRTVLTALGSNKQELSKSALNFLVSLVVSGAADVAMDTAKAWAATADPSLIRYFIQLVLDTVAGPYSQSFARCMISIMHYGHMTRMKPTHRHMLYEFAQACNEVGFLPPLNAKDQDLLEELLRP